MKSSFRRLRIISLMGNNCRKLENGGRIIGGSLFLVCIFLPRVKNGKFMQEHWYNLFIIVNLSTWHAHLARKFTISHIGPWLIALAAIFKCIVDPATGILSMVRAISYAAHK